MNLFMWVIRLALTIGLGEAFVDMTAVMRGKAIEAHRRGPISHQLFTRQLTK